MTPSDLFHKFSRFSSQLLSKKIFPIFQLQIWSRFRGLNKIAPFQHPPKIARVLGDVQARTQTEDRPGLTKTLTDHPPVNPVGRLATPDLRQLRSNRSLPTLRRPTPPQAAAHPLPPWEKSTRPAASARPSNPVPPPSHSRPRRPGPRLERPTHPPINLGPRYSLIENQYSHATVIPT